MSLIYIKQKQEVQQIYEIHSEEKRIPYTGEIFTNLTNEELMQFKTMSAKWLCLPESPCIKQPRINAVSIYKMLENQIVKTPADRGRLRKYLGNFTQTPEGIPFRKLFKQCLKKLSFPTQNSTSDNAQTNIVSLIESKLVVIGKDYKKYHYLMPAFFHLLTWLLENKYNFAIFIRTYGKDGPHILSAIQAYMNKLHPTEKPPTNAKLNIDYSLWILDRNDKGPMFNLYNENSKIKINKPREIYNFWSSWDGAVSIVDDFNYWQRHNYTQNSAKPFWIDLKDEQTHHIIFDDNIRFGHDGTNGIDLRSFDESNEDYNLNTNEAEKFENVYFVQADLLNIIQNKQYFIEKIKECQKKLNQLQLRSSANL